MPRFAIRKFASSRLSQWEAAVLLSVTCAATVVGQAASSAVNIGSRARVAVTFANGSSAIFAAADTGGTVLGQGSTKESVPATVPSRSPYVGAQFGYSLNGSGGATGNLIAAGGVMYNVIAPSATSAAKAKFFLPIRGNLAGLTADTASSSKKVQQLLSSVQGIRIGAEPYLLLPDISPSIHPVLFGSAGWKINSAKDKADTTRYITAGRASLGAELGLGANDGSKLPVTIDLSYVWTGFADRNYRMVFGQDFPKHLQSGEFTVVMPIAANTGVVSELIFGQHALPVWRIGVVLVAAGGK